MEDRAYQTGQRFKVVQAGARLVGLQADRPNSHLGWRRDLAIGEIVTVGHVGFGFGSDPGHGTHFQVDEPGVHHAHFHPSIGGIWNYRPDPTYLEEV